MTFNLHDFSFKEFKAKARQIVGDEHGVQSETSAAIGMDRTYFNYLFMRDRDAPGGEGAKEPGAIKWLARFCGYKGVDPGWLLGLPGYNRPYTRDRVYLPRTTEEADQVADAVDGMDWEHRQLVVGIVRLIAGVAENKESATHRRLSRRIGTIKNLSSLVLAYGDSEIRERAAMLLADSGLSLDEWYGREGQEEIVEQERGYAIVL